MRFFSLLSVIIALITSISAAAQSNTLNCKNFTSELALAVYEASSQKEDKIEDSSDLYTTELDGLFLPMSSPKDMENLKRKIDEGRTSFISVQREENQSLQVYSITLKDSDTCELESLKSIY